MWRSIVRNRKVVGFKEFDFVEIAYSQSTRCQPPDDAQAEPVTARIVR